MRTKKAVWKNFMDYEKEEKYLCAMNEKGWRFTHVSFLLFYHFEKCEPGKAVYRMDYHREKMRNNPEYIQMFSDCGWEHVCDYLGYSYFRKEGTEGEDPEEIFCDHDSRQAMRKRAFMGMYFPLICVFVLMIIPEIFMLSVINKFGDVLLDVFAFVLLILAITSLLVFTIKAVQFYRYEKQGAETLTGIRLKYAGIFTLIAAIFVGLGALCWSTYRSSYKVIEKDDGFVVEAEKLNTSVVKEYDLEKGDVVDFNYSVPEGVLRCGIAENGEEFLSLSNYVEKFHAHTENGEDGLMVNRDGHLQIIITGKRMAGVVEIKINKTRKYSASAPKKKAGK